MADNSQDRISSIIDLQATQAEIEALKRQIIDLVSHIKGTSINIMQSNSHAEVSKLSKELDSLIDTTEKQTVSIVKASKSQKEFDKTVLESRVQKQQYNKELKTQIELENAAANSIDEAKAKVKSLTAERNKLNLATEEGQKRLIEINDEINKQNEFIKHNSSELEKQRINVGNYQGSAKIIVAALKDVEDEISKLQQKQQGLVNLSKSNPIGFQLSGGQKGLDDVNAQLGFAIQKSTSLHNIVDDPKFLNIASNIGDTNKELKFFTQRLNELEDAGLKDSELYKELQKRLAHLTDQLSDTREELKALASDTHAFDLFAESVKFLADVFETTAGAVALLGGNEEEVEKVTKNLIAIQSIANGVRGIATEITTKGTAANKAYNIVLQQGQILFGKGATAAQRFGVAINSIAAIAFAAILFRLVDLMGSFSDKAEDAKDNLEKLNREIEKNNRLTKDLQQSLSFDTKSNIETLKAAGATKKQIFDEEIKGRREQIKLFQKELESAQEDEIREEFRQNTLRRQMQLNGLKTISKDRADADRAALEAVHKNTEDKKQQLKQAYQDLVLFEKEEITRTEDEKRDAAKKQGELNAEIIQRNLAAQLGLDKLAVQNRINFNERIIENDKRSLIERLDALRKFNEDRKLLVELQEDFDLKRAGLTKDEKKLIQRTAEEEIIKIQVDTDDKKLQLVEDFNKKLSDEDKELHDQLKLNIENTYKKFIEAEENKTKKAKEEADKKKQIAKEQKDLEIKLLNEIENAVVALIDGRFESQKNAIQREIDLIDERKEKNIKAAGDNADAVSVIEKNAQSDKERLQRKQRDLDVRKAQFDKAASIARIIQETAIQVVANLSKPILIPLIIAIGAAQLASVVAQPIPRYGKGTEKHKGGLMVVGDAGKHEILELPDGRLFKTPNVDTYVSAPTGTKVYEDINKFITKTTLTNIPKFQNYNQSDNSGKIIYALSRVEKAVINIPQQEVKVDNIISRRIRSNGKIYIR